MEPIWGPETGTGGWKQRRGKLLILAASPFRDFDSWGLLVSGLLGRLVGVSSFFVGRLIGVSSFFVEKEAYWGRLIGVEAYWCQFFFR